MRAFVDVMWKEEVKERFVGEVIAWVEVTNVVPFEKATHVGS